ncbi:MAG: M48 family metalloprotease [Elusimicrobiota bacterium]
MRKILAAFLAFAIVILSPGIDCYAQVADVIDAPAAQGAAGFPGQDARAGQALVPISLGADLGVLESAQNFLIPTPANLAAPPDRPEIARPIAAVSPAPRIPNRHKQKSINRAAAVLASPLILAQSAGQSAAANPVATEKSGPSRGAREFFSFIRKSILRQTAPWRKGEIAPSHAVGAAQAAPLLAGALRARASAASGGVLSPPPSPPGQGQEPPQSPRPSRFKAVAGVALRLAAGAAVIIGAQSAASFVAPSAFALVPAAALWAVTPGLLVLPAALYLRYYWLSRRDSPRLSKIKWIYDLGIGAYLGGFWFVLPHVGIAAALASVTPRAAAAGALIAGTSAVGTAATLKAGGRPTDALIAAWAAGGLSVLMSAAHIGASISLGPLLAMAAIPALVTLAFFHGSLVMDAETGRPFSLGKSGILGGGARFPAFNWIMLGVIFAALSGYAPTAVHILFAHISDINIAIGAWMLLSNKPAFNYLYGALLAYVALTHFASPWTYVALAFAPDRARALTETLLTKIVPKGTAAPSTLEPNQKLAAADAPVTVPKTKFWIRTAVLLGTLAGLVALAPLFFGSAHLVVGSLILGTLFSGASFVFSKAIIKRVEHVTPLDPDHDSIDAAVLEVGLKCWKMLNNRRMAEKKPWQFWVKPYPEPEFADDPMPIPNAYATGASPRHALMAVTLGMREMLFDPGTLSRTLSRLLIGQDPKSLEFWAYRREIRRFIPELSADAAPDQAAQAVMRATPGQLKDLGKDLLLAVWSHEVSHERYHHMLIGAVAGDLNMTVSNAAYGYLWTVGQIGAAFKSLARRFSRRAGPDGAPGGDIRRRRSRGNLRPEIVDPVSLGLLIKETPVFVAQWSSLLMQILQTASSRNDESQADAGGAEITGHPESLAMALGLLTSWRPPRGFSLNASARARLTAFSHIFMMDPGEQLSRKHDFSAPAADLSGARPVRLGRGENFLFELLAGTHPETSVRIQTLARMAKSAEAEKSASDPQAGTGITAQGPPSDPAQASSVDNSAPVQNRGHFFKRAAAWIARFYRVFPDKVRNKEFWSFIWAQVIITQGSTFYSTALPAFVAPGKAQSGRMGTIRTASFASQLSANVAMGPTVDQKPTSSLLFKTYFGRGILLAVVPILYFTAYHHGLFPFWPLAAILIGMSFLQSAGVLASNVGFNRLLGQDPAYYNKANAANSLVVNLAGVLSPLIAGAFIAWANLHFGGSSGNALAFGIYGLAAVVTALIYRKLKLVNREAAPPSGAKRFLFSPGLVARLKGAASSSPAGVRAWIKTKARVFVEIKKGLSLLWHDRFLRLNLVFSTVSLVVGDAIFFLALPLYIRGAVTSAAMPAFLAHAPMIGHWLTGFMSEPSAVFGLFLAASNLGAAVFDIIFIFRRSKAASDNQASSGSQFVSRATHPAAPRSEIFSRMRALSLDVLHLPFVGAIGKWIDGKLGSNLTHMEKQGVWSSVLNGAGWIAGLSLFLTSHLWLALAAFAASSFLQSPASTIWSSLEQIVLNKNYSNDQAKLWSAMSVYSQIFTMAGDLLFGVIMMKFSTHLALGVVMAVMGAAALLAIVQPFVIFRRSSPSGPKTQN